MGFEDRRRQILNQLSHQPLLFFQDLEQLLDVSPTTIRRDLTVLEKQGDIIRFHGGIKKNKGVAEISMAKKQTLNTEAKKQIARYAASLIKPNSLIFIASGSTTYPMIDYLEDTSVTVVTNGIPHAEALNKKHIRAFLLCGYIKERTRSTAGDQTVKMISSFTFDQSFVGANGIGANLDLLSADEYEHNIKTAAIQSSNRTYIMADHSKFCANAMYRISSAEHPEVYIITDQYSGEPAGQLIDVVTSDSQASSLFSEKGLV